METMNIQDTATVVDGSLPELAKIGIQVSGTIYLDVTDLIQYARHNSTLSGVQRVLRGLLDNIRGWCEANPNINVRPVIADYDRCRIYSVDIKLILLMVDVVAIREGDGKQIETLLRAIFESRSIVLHRVGDVFIIAGAFWTYKFYDIVVNLRSRGVRFGIFVHDLIHINNPEFVTREAIHSFRTSFIDALTLANFVFTSSEFVAREVKTFLATRLNFSLPVHVVALATELQPLNGKKGVIKPSLLNVSTNDYILSVGTIEPRKNQFYLIKIWERLIAEFSGEIPNLVFVGKWGHHSDEFKNYVDRSDDLCGRLHIFNNVSDIALAHLYEHCLFTAYPSFAEGFGLPVGESLAYGKPCVASNKTSVPEAGGAFARYIDPNDLNQGYEVFRALLSGRKGLGEWTANIRANYRPKTWTEFSHEFFDSVVTFTFGKTMKGRESNCLLDAGKFYFMGDDDLIRLDRDHKPLVTLRMARFSGWHPTEPWGCWASERQARLKFGTRLKAGAKVSVFLLVHVPPGSIDAVCKVHIGGASTVLRDLNADASWRLADGIVSEDGSLDITLQAIGEFGRPDDRHLFIGLHALAYCESKALQKRASLMAKAALSLTARVCGGLVRKFSKNAHVERPIRTLEPINELAELFRKVGSGDAESVAPGLENQLAALADKINEDSLLDFDDESAALEFANDIDSLAPELVPRKPHELIRTFDDRIHIEKIGSRYERSHWGVLRTMRGIVAIRGFCISSEPLLELQIALDGQLIYRGPLKGKQFEGGRENQRKYVFNVWYDVSKFVLGRYEIEFRFVGVNQDARVHREHVAIAAPRSESQYPESDGLISDIPADGRSLEEIINSQPSMIRSAKRAVFETLPRNVLVMRTDQLGDMVCSVPALRRLRELLPDARIVGLLTSANEGLARSLKVFDEIIIADFPDDRKERRRIMPLQKQRELRQELEKYKFDIAIDFAESGVSRPLLLLSGAPFKLGFKPDEFPWLSSGIDGGTRDIVNGMQRVPHTNVIVGLIEWLGTLLKSQQTIVRRSDLTRAMLLPFGLAETDRFVVLHTGARLEFSRWPYYFELASMLLKHTNLKVVMMSDDPMERLKLNQALTESDRFTLIDKRPSFDEFDAMLSFCDVFVGNDSGPKHLASLRGANVVSIHMARNNWNEWGQENRGFIISRKVPCAGCVIQHEPEECGKDFACIVNVTPMEVFDTVRQLL
jgi:ADP-heptose:LPS heptosyltransferase/glycosyltransferase involved in cell wall biosynthesis